MNVFNLNFKQDKIAIAAEAPKTHLYMYRMCHFLTRNHTGISRQCYRHLILAPTRFKVKLSLCLTKHYAMKTYGGVDVGGCIWSLQCNVMENVSLRSTFFIVITFSCLHNFLMCCTDNMYFAIFSVWECWRTLKFVLVLWISHGRYSSGIQY
jgi:hypothetical protein